MHCSGRFFYHNLIPPKTLFPPSASVSASLSPPKPNPSPSPSPILRRHIFSSSLLLLVAAPTPVGADNAPPSRSTCPQSQPASPTKQAFLDISIDGQPVGRIIIGLYSDTVPGGSARFIKLISGAAGVTYRRKEFVKIMPNYVQHGGLRSYGVDAEMARKTGGDLAADSLVKEWEKQSESCVGTKNVSRSASIIVRDPLKPPAKLKLVARKGKLEIDEEEMGKDPNGTEFVIAVNDSPELDNSALVIGTVVEGMDVAERIRQVKTVQENTSSPYFRVAKLIGDKRAVVAERGFNRPYSKHFWVAISMVFFVAATLFTLLKLCRDVGALGWWDLFINYGIAECFAFLVCTKWSNPIIHRNSQTREESSSSSAIRYLDWNSGLVVSSEDHLQDRLCGLEDIGGHIMKIPIIVFQVLLCMKLEGTPPRARNTSLPVVFSPIFLLEGVAVVFAISRLVEKSVLLLRSVRQLTNR